MSRAHSEQTAVLVSTFMQHNVQVPFSRRSRRHTEGLLQVELSCGDRVGRLRQADAAISKELETSS